MILNKRQYSIALLITALSGCGGNPVQYPASGTPVEQEQLVDLSNIPAWVMSPPSPSVSACALIKNGDVYSAKQVALAKAQAQKVTEQKAQLSTTSHIQEDVNVVNNKAVSEISVNNQINVQAEGTVDHRQVVIEERQVLLSGKPLWCVLLGAAPAKPAS